MYDIIRDSPFGQIVRFVTNKRYLKYTEERDDFQHPHYNPSRFQDEDEKPLDASENNIASGIIPERTTSAHSTSNTSRDETSEVSDSEARTDVEEGGDEDNPIKRVVTAQSVHDIEKQKSIPIKPTRTSDGIILVDWYTTGMLSSAHPF